MVVGLIIGFIAGVNVGVFVFSLLSINKHGK